VNVCVSAALPRDHQSCPDRTPLFHKPPLASAPDRP